MCNSGLRSNRSRRFSAPCSSGTALCFCADSAAAKARLQIEGNSSEIYPAFRNTPTHGHNFLYFDVARWDVFAFLEANVARRE